VQVNAADPFCTAALSNDHQTIEVHKSLGAGTSSTTIDLPPLPPSDRWFAFDVRLTLVATDPAGKEVGTQNAGGVSETNRACPTPRTSSSPVSALPATGDGGHVATANHATAVAFSLIAGLAGGAIVAVGHGVSLKRRC
jgi:hypothetical protein